MLQAWMRTKEVAGLSLMAEAAEKGFLLQLLPFSHPVGSFWEAFDYFGPADSSRSPFPSANHLQSEFQEGKAVLRGM